MLYAQSTAKGHIKAKSCRGNSTEGGGGDTPHTLTCVGSVWTGKNGSSSHLCREIVPVDYGSWEV